MRSGGQGGSIGNGRAQSESNIEGGNTMAEGEKGSFGASSFGAKTKSWADEWATNKNSAGESQAQRSQWLKNDQSNNMSKGESVGKGSVGSNSDNNGGVVEA